MYPIEIVICTLLSTFNNCIMCVYLFYNITKLFFCIIISITHERQTYGENHRTFMYIKYFKRYIIFIAIFNESLILVVIKMLKNIIIVIVMN